MKSDNNTEESVSITHTPKPDNIFVSAMLSSSEFEQLRREKKGYNAYAKEAFSRLKQQ